MHPACQFPAGMIVDTEHVHCRNTHSNTLIVTAKALSFTTDALLTVGSHTFSARILGFFAPFFQLSFLLLFLFFSLILFFLSIYLPHSPSLPIFNFFAIYVTKFSTDKVTDDPYFN